MRLFRATMQQPLLAWPDLIRSEFGESPGLSLTLAQACRLWGLEPVQCRAVLEALVEAGFLRRTRDGTYLSGGQR